MNNNDSPYPNFSVAVHSTSFLHIIFCDFIDEHVETNSLLGIFTNVLGLVYLIKICYKMGTLDEKTVDFVYFKKG